MLAFLRSRVEPNTVRRSGFFHRGCQNNLHRDDGKLFERKQKTRSIRCLPTYFNQVISGSTMNRYNLRIGDSERGGEWDAHEGSLRATATYPELHENTIIDCVVCHYWSERLEMTRAHPLSTLGAFEEEKRLIAVLKGHQSYGACARRLPHLLDILLDSR